MRGAAMTERDAKPGALGVLGGIGLGGALMYFLDPDRGTLRRKRVRDRLVHARSVASEGLGTTGRDLGNRVRGLAATTRSHLRSDDADDRIIEERVRNEIGRVVSHPSALTVTAEQGRVTLSGPVLAREFDDLLARVRKVRGVTDVGNRLEVHETADGVPGLQGGVRRTGGEFELRQENWTPAARLATSVIGGAIALYGARRRDAAGAALGLAGLALFARGATNNQFKRLTGVGGGRRAVDVQKTINVTAPVETVFGFFTEWESWPRWMSHVRQITASGARGAVGERTHWVVDGPAGTTLEWDAEPTRFVPNEEIAWKTVEDAAVEHAGVLRFDRNADGSTRVHIRMSYNPPAGAVGHAVAALLGRDPRHQMDDDLARLKTTIETGIPPHDAAQPEAYAISDTL